MRRTSTACVVVALGVLGAPWMAEAQQATKMYRIGWLGAGDAPTVARRNLSDLQQGLRDAGYVEGRSCPDRISLRKR